MPHNYDNISEALRRDREFLKKKQAERSAMADNKTLYYAGIGSRKTPEYILRLMTQLAEKLREDGFVLRSGHAPGADQAFEFGAGAYAQIFLPWRTFEQDVAFVGSRDELGNITHPVVFDAPTVEAKILARQYHPAWDALKDGAQLLHARNTHQILGPKPQSRPTPVEFVLCWTPDGTASGGTGQAIRVAEDKGIPVHNLWHEDVYDMAFEWAWGDSDE